MAYGLKACSCHPLIQTNVERQTEYQSIRPHICRKSLVCNVNHSKNGGSLNNFCVTLVITSITGFTVYI